GGGGDGRHLRPAGPGVPVSRQPGCRCPAAGDRAGRVRAGARRVRADGEPVPGALCRRTQPGLGPGGQRRLAVDHRGRPADRAVRAPLRRGALARGGHHPRPDRLRGRAAFPGPPVPRPGRAARLCACRPGGPGRRGSRDRGRAAGDGLPAQRRRHAAGQRGGAGSLPRRGGGGRRRGSARGDAQGDPPMKVAFVLGTSTGGTARHVRTLAAGCAARGVTAGVFGPEQTDRDFGFSRLAGGQVSFTPVDIADRPRVARDLRAIRRLRRLLAAWRPDVAHAHGLRAGALTAIALAFVRPTVYYPRPALVVTVHNAPPAGGATGAVYRVLERIVASRADSVLCVSPDLEERMRAAGARRVGRALVPAAVPAEASAETPAEASAARP